MNVLGFMPGVNRFLSFDFVDVIWAVRVEMVFYFVVFLVLLIPDRKRLPALVPYALAGLGLATALVARQFGYGFFFFFGVLLYDYRRYPVSLPLCALGMSFHFVNRVRNVVRGKRLQAASSYAAHDSAVQRPTV